MYKVIVDRECGCFRRSAMENNIEIESKDDALMKGLEMVKAMNEEFCKKHTFSLEEAENTFIVKMS